VPGKYPSFFRQDEGRVVGDVDQTVLPEILEAQEFLFEIRVEIYGEPGFYVLCVNGRIPHDALLDQVVPDFVVAGEQMADPAFDGKTTEIGRASCRERVS
jgi:hypothetical protein